MTRIIQLTPYDPRWPHIFRQEARDIGSTAIPGIKAKPIMDCLIEVRQIEAINASDEAINALGYDPCGENGNSGRRYFCQSNRRDPLVPRARFPYRSSKYCPAPGFRNYLRAHHDQAQAYNKLKERLANRFCDDSVAYTDGKSEFVREIDRCVAIWSAC